MSDHNPLPSAHRRAVGLATLGLCALLGLAGQLQGCSGSTGGTDAGPPVDAGNIRDALGLALGNCYEFTTLDTAANPPALGVAVVDGLVADLVRANLVQRQGEVFLVPSPATKIQKSNRWS